MKTLALTFYFVFAGIMAFSQISYNLVTTSTGVQYASPSALGPKTEDDYTVEYAGVGGTPFWQEDWDSALVMLNSGGAVILGKAKLNFYSNEILFKGENDKIFAAPKTAVKEIYFFNKKDSGKTAAVFAPFRDVKSRYNDIEAPFCQVLNRGGLQLIKLVSITLDKRNDYAQGKDVYSFHSNTDYCLVRGNFVYGIKKLSNENIMAYVLPNDAAVKWLEQNKNKLRNETDVVNFLNYLNTAR
jgi:hypothetical protein